MADPWYWVNASYVARHPGPMTRDIAPEGGRQTGRTAAIQAADLFTDGHDDAVTVSVAARHRP